jgi:hypothetical protein
MLNIEAYRIHMRQLGETVRWFKCLPSYDAGFITSSTATAGFRWAEATVSAAVRVLVREQREEFQHPEFGLIHVGDMIMTTMADEIRVAFQDQFVFPQRLATEREAVTRAASGDDSLVHPYPVSLLAVSDANRSYVVGTAAAGDCYLTVGGAVAWRVGAAHKPTAGNVYTVEYSYNPLYWYMSGKERAPRPVPLDATALTPQQVVLSKKLPGD